MKLSEKIRRGAPIPPVFDILLRAATPAVRLGMRWRLARPRVCVGARVISFGNITVGGTGKTPAVIERARLECEAGGRVAVLTRGYGSRRGPEPLVAAPGSYAPGLAERIGDEPALILRRVPEVFVVKAADRVCGARLAVEEHGCDTLILDDGFQHVALERDENVLVIDATNPFGNGHLVPRGILREPLEAMGRATSILLTRCDQAEELDGVAGELAVRCPGAPIRRTRHAPSRLWRVATGEELELDTLAGAAVCALCAIGNPEAFVDTLTSLGAEVAERMTFRDHARISGAGLASERAVVVTEKDAVRMVGVGENVLALGIDLQDCCGL